VFESLQQADATKSISYVLELWKMAWGVTPSWIPKPKPRPTAEEVEAALATFDAKATKEQCDGKSSEVLSLLAKCLADPRYRKMQFHLWRATLNARADFTHEKQATIMQNMCALFDISAKLVGVLLAHPGLREDKYDILTNVDNWDKKLRERFDELYSAVSPKCWDTAELHRFSDGLLYCLGRISDHRLLGLEVWKEICPNDAVYQIRSREPFYYLPDRKEESVFSEEELLRFAREREEILAEGVDDVEQPKSLLRKAQSQVSVAHSKLKCMKEELTAKKDMVVQLGKAVKELEGRLAAAAVRKQPRDEDLPLLQVDQKRARLDMLSTPAAQVVGLTKVLGDIFHFLAHLEKANGKFQVRDALRHAYLRASQDRGESLDWTDADTKAKDRLKALGPILVTAGATKERFGKVEAMCLSYPALADMLLQERQFSWFRTLHTTVVGNMLLPSAEVHLALASHLSIIRTEVDVATVCAVMGVPPAIAKRIVPNLLKLDSSGTAKVMQCLQMVKGTRKRDEKRQCKQRLKVNGAEPGIPRCGYHKVAAV
jgi:hypothetical protein